jgi:hypothetical protein
MTTALEGGEGSASQPGRSLPPGKTRYQLHRRLGGPQGRSGQVQKISPPPGFDPRTVQSVATHHTDWATQHTLPSAIFNNTASFSSPFDYYQSKPTLFCSVLPPPLFPHPSCTVIVIMDVSSTVDIQLFLCTWSDGRTRFYQLSSQH